MSITLDPLHEWLCLVLGVLTHSVAGKATHVVFVNEICGLSRVDVVVTVYGTQVRFKFTDYIEGQTKPDRLVSKF